MTSLNVVESQALTIGKVPVRNLWLLMLYASDLYRELGKQFSSVEDAPDEIPDLIARMLCQATEKRLRRNLSLGYTQRNAHLNRLRGRIDVLETARHNLFSKGQIACRFDELTVNTPRNQIYKSSIRETFVGCKSPGRITSVSLTYKATLRKRRYGHKARTQRTL